MASRSVLTCDPMTGMPAASSTGHITHCRAPTSRRLRRRVRRWRAAHTCWAPTGPPSCRRRSPRPMLAHRPTSSIPPAWLSAAKRALTADRPLRIGEELADGHHDLDRCSLDRDGGRVGMTGTDRGYEDSRHDHRGHDAARDAERNGRNGARGKAPHYAHSGASTPNKCRWGVETPRSTHAQRDRVPGVGFEPTCPEGQSVLSRLRQPVAPSGRTAMTLLRSASAVLVAQRRTSSVANGSTGGFSPGLPGGSRSGGAARSRCRSCRRNR